MTGFPRNDSATEGSASPPAIEVGEGTTTASLSTTRKILLSVWGAVHIDTKGLRSTETDDRDGRTLCIASVFMYLFFLISLSVHAFAVTELRC